MDGDMSDLQRAGRFCRRWLTAILLVAGVILLVERLGYAGAWSAPGLDPGTVPAQLLLSLSSLLYLGALWRLRGAAAQVERGNAFGREAVAAMRSVGLLLVAGALTSLIVPLLLSRLGDQPPLRLIDADIASLAIAAVGIGQFLIGGLLGRAAAAERELADFF